MSDERKFDGPYDKREMREVHKSIVKRVFEGDIMIRVPGAAPTDDEKANRGRLVEVPAEPGDTGRRWTHLYLDRKGEGEPISFDAGSCGLWVSPGGWRALVAWHHDDPTYGLNVVIFDPLGKIHKQAREAGPEIEGWIDAELP